MSHGCGRCRPAIPTPAEKHENDDLDIHCLAQDTILTPAADHSPGYGERLEHTCAAAHFTPAAMHPVEGVPNLLGMVTAGYGVALLPEVLVRGQVPASQVRRLRAPVPPFRLNLLWLRQSTSQVLRNFLLVARESADRTCAVSS